MTGALVSSKAHVRRCRWSAPTATTQRNTAVTSNSAFREKRFSENSYTLILRLKNRFGWYPGTRPQKGCPANSEFRTGYRDKSPQDTTRVWSYDFAYYVRFYPDFFAGYARSIVKKGAEGIPSGRREGQKAAPRKTVRNRLPEIPGRAAKNRRSGRSVRSARCGIIRPRRSGGPTERPSLPHRACPAGDSREKIARLPGTIQG